MSRNPGGEGSLGISSVEAEALQNEASAALAAALADPAFLAGVTISPRATASAASVRAVGVQDDSDDIVEAIDVDETDAAPSEPSSDGNTCPACGFMTLPSLDHYGSYNMCTMRHCDWEDDGLQLANPCMDGGANSDSLFKEQLRLLVQYPESVRTHGGYNRDPRWRPLNENEASDATAREVAGETRSPVIDLTSVYWLQ
jgi:hypothetical protein